MKKVFYVFIAAFLAFASLSGCSSVKPAQSIVSAVPAGVTVNEVRQAIISAANDRGWVLSENGNDSFIANHSRNIYSATVKIDYSATQYVISYVNSTGFKTDANGGIDKHYNDWVINLDKDIKHAINNQQNMRLASKPKKG